MEKIQSKDHVDEKINEKIILNLVAAKRPKYIFIVKHISFKIRVLILEPPKQIRKTRGEKQVNKCMAVLYKKKKK